MLLSHSYLQQWSSSSKKGACKPSRSTSVPHMLTAHLAATIVLATAPQEKFQCQPRCQLHMQQSAVDALGWIKVALLQAHVYSTLSQGPTHPNAHGGKDDGVGG